MFLDNLGSERHWGTCVLHVGHIRVPSKTTWRSWSSWTALERCCRAIRWVIPRLSPLSSFTVKLIFDFPSWQSPRHTLQRTFSDESLCSGRRDASFACSENQTTHADLLFTCTLPTRKHSSSSNHMQGKKSECYGWQMCRIEDFSSLVFFTQLISSFLSSVPLSSSELSLTEVKDKVPPLRRLDPGLMPLPDTACGLEWSSLVNAAKAYEGEERSKCKFDLAKCLIHLTNTPGKEKRNWAVITQTHFFYLNL